MYRVMKEAKDGKPVVGRTGTSLGVRIPLDIKPDENGDVSPNTGGMSVSPSLYTLPPLFVPVRLHALVPKARGSNHLRVWKMGAGPFDRSPVAPGLELRPDSRKHGTIQPDQLMTLLAYEDALAATRDQWVIDETGG
jgi:hypothetical protein